jgi:hypothetical protein
MDHEQHAALYSNGMREHFAEEPEQARRELANGIFTVV